MSKEENHEITKENTLNFEKDINELDELDNGKNNEEKVFFSNIKINKQKKFKISNKNNQLITFAIIQESEDNIIFNAIINNLNEIKIYQRKFSISDFIKKNNFYKQFDNIGELFSNFLAIIEEKSISFQEEKDKLKLILNIPSIKNPNSSFFYLLPQNKDNDSILNHLYESYKIQKIENDILKSEIQNNKNDIAELSKKLNQLIIIGQNNDKNNKDIKEIQQNLIAVKKDNEILKEQNKKITKEYNKKIDEQRNEIKNLKKIVEENKIYLENLIRKNKDEINNLNERLTKFINIIKLEQNMNLILYNQSKELFEKQTDISKKKLEYNESQINRINNHFYNQIRINKEKIGNLYIDIENIKENLNNLIKDNEEIMDIKSDIIKFNEFFIIRYGVYNKLNKYIRKYRLLFKASKDGFRAKDFHNYCDGRANTLTLVKTKTGRRFGGFTDQKWDQNGNKSGSNGFLFSLDFKEIYYNKDSSYNIQGNSSYGPYFGNDFYIGDNCDSDCNSYDSSGSCYETKGKSCSLAGENKFIVEDYEVYELIIL